MMESQRAFHMLEESALMAGLRGDFPPQKALAAADALMSAKINIFELTMNSVQPIDAMQAIKARYGEGAVVGMGTVLTVAHAKQVIDAGADFVVAPSFSREVTEFVVKSGVLMIPGAITPTEIVDAWRAGAHLIKLFPIGPLTVEYFKAIRGPLGHLKFICNGGMTDENVPAFIKAGAVACGMANWLTGDGSMSPNMIQQRAQTLRRLVDQARGRGGRII